MEINSKATIIMKKELIVKEEDLDQIEFDILRETLEDKSLIVSGCAGSGKSLMAVKLAQRIEKEIKSPHKILVYTKALEEFLREGARILELSSQLTHYHLWRWKYDKKGNIIGDNRTRTDYFIVDEIQDFTKGEVHEFINYTNKHFLFFGDTAQTLYSDRNPLPVCDIKKLIPKGHKYKEYSLYYNYRLPVHIAEAVQWVGDNLEPFEKDKYKSKEDTYTHLIKYTSFQDEIEEIANYCKEKRSSDVAILVPTREDVIRMFQGLENYGIHCEIKYDAPETYQLGKGNVPDNYRISLDTLDMSTDNPKIMTFHSSKGLQFETVFVAGIKDYDNAYLKYLRKPLYVAMTRTYKNLYVLYSGWLPHPLSDIPKTLFIDSMIDYKVLDK